MLPVHKMLCTRIVSYLNDLNLLNENALVDEIKELSDIDEETAENACSTQHNDKSSISDSNLGKTSVAKSSLPSKNIDDINISAHPMIFNNISFANVENFVTLFNGSAT